MNQLLGLASVDPSGNSYYLPFYQGMIWGEDSALEKKNSNYT
jgi:hypothetical protein